MLVIVLRTTGRKHQKWFGSLALKLSKWLLFPPQCYVVCLNSFWLVHVKVITQPTLQLPQDRYMFCFDVMFQFNMSPVISLLPDCDKLLIPAIVYYSALLCVSLPNYLVSHSLHFYFVRSFIVPNPAYLKKFCLFSNEYGPSQYCKPEYLFANNVAQPCQKSFS